MGRRAGGLFADVVVVLSMVNSKTNFLNVLDAIVMATQQLRHIIRPTCSSSSSTIDNLDDYITVLFSRLCRRNYPIQSNPTHPPFSAIDEIIIKLQQCFLPVGQLSNSINEEERERERESL